MLSHFGACCLPFFVVAFRGRSTPVLLAALFQVVDPGGPGAVQNWYESHGTTLPALLARSQLLQP